MFKQDDIKHYPHFDRHLKLKEIDELVNDTERVAKHKFYPFFLYHESWQPFRSKKDESGERSKPDIKSRPIRYAARKDAYIMMHYRKLLSEKYESRLKKRNLENCPLAYRKIPKANGSGKSNIDFAKDAFDKIDELGDCLAIALDIKGFFENLDHDRIKSMWCELLDVDRLPSDHFTIFKNITNYSYVDQKQVYRRLGIIDTVYVDGYERDVFTVRHCDMPVQLCSPKEFREKICKKGSSLVQKNHENCGVPQGAPISDLIANFYLLEFDSALNSYAIKNGGAYMRYSDDILLILPTSVGCFSAVERFAQTEMRKMGKKLEIKSEKTSVVQFNTSEGGRKFIHKKGKQGKNGFEYLGFRYDGKKVYVRDSTMSRLYRKVARTARGVAAGFANGHPNLGIEDILRTYNYSDFSQRFNRVSPEALSPDDFKTWTFYSYLRKASETFGDKGSPIIPQARGFSRFMKSRFEEALSNAVQNRDLSA